MKLVALVLAFVIGYTLQQNRQGLVKEIRSWFEKYSQWFHKQVPAEGLGHGWVGAVLFALVPAVLITLVINLMGAGQILFVLILHSAILLLCLIPVDPFSTENENSSPKVSEQAVSEPAVSEQEAATNEDNSVTAPSFNMIELVSVVFWYLVVGPVGALTMRLVFVGQQSSRMAQIFDQVNQILLWLPIRCLMMSYALVGNFHKVFETTLEDSLRLDRESLELEKTAAKAALMPEVAEMNEEESRLLYAALYRRALLCWLAVIAIASLTI